MITRIARNNVVYTITTIYNKSNHNHNHNILFEEFLWTIDIALTLTDRETILSAIVDDDNDGALLILLTTSAIFDRRNFSCCHSDIATAATRITTFHHQVFLISATNNQFVINSALSLIIRK